VLDNELAELRQNRRRGHLFSHNFLTHNSRLVPQEMLGRQGYDEFERGIGQHALAG
jgi:hypothetical protein